MQAEQQACGDQSETLMEKMRNEGWREEKLNILHMLQDELAKKGMEKPMNLRNVERSLLKRVVGDVNEVIGIFDTQYINETNRLLVEAANVVAKRLGVRKPTAKRGDEKRRIKQKIKHLRKNISRLERVVTGQLRRAEIIEQLERYRRNTAVRSAQWNRRRSAEREAVVSNLGRANTQGLS